MTNSTSPESKTTATKCAACGKPVLPENSVTFESKTICAVCSPRFFQSLREGVSADEFIRSPLKAKINPLALVWWPIYLTLFMILWTACVSPFSVYGDDWAIMPVVAILPFVFIIHVILIIRKRANIKFIIYGVVHIMLLFQGWLLCLALISKDSI